MYSLLTMLWYFRWTAKRLSDTYTCIHSPLNSLQSRLSHNIEQSSLCYTVGSYYLNPDFWPPFGLFHKILLFFLPSFFFFSNSSILMLFICTSLRSLKLHSTIYSFLSNKSLSLKFLHLCISSHLSPTPYFWSICLYRTEKVWVFSIIIIINFNAFDPWTTQGLGALVLPTLYLIVGPLYLQFLHIHSLTSMDSTNYRSSSSVLFTFEKHWCISGSVQFKPVLSKDQLC